MGTYYQDLDSGWFDYDLQSVAGVSDQLFRGPAVDLSRPYVACVGAAQTFGRFAAQPFAALLAQRLGLQILNLGVGGAGPRLFDSPQYLELLNGAEAVVVQVLSGRSERNSLFDNSDTRNLFGIRVSDNKSMRFEDFLGDLVKSGPPELVRRAVQETRESYVRHMVGLLDGIRRPKVLLWFSDRTPDYRSDFSSAWGILGSFPQLVDAAMVAEVRAHADAYVECVSARGIPQRLWKSSQEIDGASLERGVLVNRYYPSPEMHADAVEMLAPVVSRFLPVVRASSDAPAVAVPGAPTRFLVVCAERTGSNVLLGLLGSHPDCFVAGELFNPRLIKAGSVPGVAESEHAELVDLRRTDPVKFVDRVFDSAAGKGYRAIGFKFMYNHGDLSTDARGHLANDKEIRVIHLKRRNLLRRLLSDRRAQSTDVWAQTADTSAPPPPAVRLGFVESVWNFGHLENKQAEYQDLFGDHAVLELFYEDLEADPQSAGERAASFLGLRAGVPLEVRFKKTGTDSLRAAIVNYDELKADMLRWASFFED
jgi:Domain of unknown function (DUF6473)